MPGPWRLAPSGWDSQGSRDWARSQVCEGSPGGCGESLGIGLDPESTGVWWGKVWLVFFWFCFSLFPEGFGQGTGCSDLHFKILEGARQGMD